MNRHAPLKEIVKPFGLVNFTGAACWYNAMLQSLLGCDPFIKFLIVHRRQFSKLPFAAKFYQLITNEDRVASGINLWRELCAKSRSASYGQQDSTEFFTDFLELFKNDILLGEFTYIRRSIIRYGPHVRSSEKQQNIIMSVTPDIMPNLANYLMSEEEIIDGYKPDDKKLDIYKATRELFLVRAPPMLVIMVKNYDFDYRSFTTGAKLYDYPTEMYFNEDREDYPTIHYKLASLICHHGSKRPGSGGHYTCYSMRGSRLYHFDDTRVSIVKEWPKNKDNYMFIYTTWDA